MSLSLHQKEKKESLYLQVYHHYRGTDHGSPASGRQPYAPLPAQMCPGAETEPGTTIESAYLQLAADGYIIAKAQSWLIMLQALPLAVSYA